MGKDKNPKGENKNAEEVDSRGILFFKDQRALMEHTAKHGTQSGVGFGAPVSSPLDALKKTVSRNVEEAKAKEEGESLPDAMTETKEETADQPQKVKKQSSLLARCMPYIYDEQGVNCAEEKPDYTLESVEEIIESAEKRASEKIARMYNLRKSENETIGEEKTEPQKTEEKPKLKSTATSVKKPVKIGDEAFSAAKLFETAPIPKLSGTLFDDLTGHRTDMVGEEKVTSAYSEQGGMQTGEETHTRTIPGIVPEADSSERMEDIMSRTRPVNVEDISSSSVKKAPVKISAVEDLDEEIIVDDFCGKRDIKRVGSMLKANAFYAKLRLIATALLTLGSGVFLLDSVKAEAEAATLCIIAAVILAVAALVNGNIFGGFKGAFTKNSSIELPVALSLSLAILFFVIAIISGNHPFDVVVLPLVTVLSYDYCNYRKQMAIFKNFKLVALRRNKKAVALIDEPSVTAAMARTVISGEVLAAGKTETAEIGDFLKNTLSDKALSGKVNVLSIVALIASVFIGVAVGGSAGSVMDGIFAALVVLCFSAAPTLFIADTMPFVSMAERLNKFKAAVCSKNSAERIEQLNALVVSSADIFPEGAIKFYNMNALSANELDNTLALAAAVSSEINSPLAPAFKKIISTEDMPVADSVKYEDNLGISGWVEDDRILIGNRSLMIAHGVRVPALEVDKKILRQGYFPVYVAVNQRACVLLVVGYTTLPDVEKRLGRIMDKGITLLVENCDPNVSEQMLCDYFGFDPELVKVMDHNGVAKYQKATAAKKLVSAHGFTLGGTESFLEIVLSCLKIRSASATLYVIHTLTSVLCWTMFAVLSLGGAGSLAGIGVCLLGELIATIVSLTAYFIFKI